VVVRPVNVDSRGLPAYPAVGLPDGDYYEGKEFVFGFGARCEFKASIPGPNVNLSCPSIEEIRSRNMKPVLGSESANIGTVWLRGKVTKLGIEAGLGGAYLDLGVGVDMTGGEIGYRITPHSSRTVRLEERSVWVKSGSEKARTETFGLIPERDGTKWGFRIDRPQYRFDVEVIPQAQILLNLDLGIYEYSDTIGPIRFDSLTISKSFEVGKYEETKGAYYFGM